jgi:WD40 repeat protein
MNFSDCIPQSNGVAHYSPNGTLIAISKNFEVKIFDTDGLRPLQNFNFVDVVSQIVWSPDSQLLLVVISKRSIVYVRNVYDPEWSCKIDEGMAGLLAAIWTPDSRFVLTVSEFKLRMTVWDLKLAKASK